MRREVLAHFGSEVAPAPYPTQRIVLGGQIEPAGRQRVAAGKEQPDGRQMQRYRHGDEPAPTALQCPGDNQHCRRDISRRPPVGMGARQQADAEHHPQGRQGKGGEQAGARFGQAAPCRDQQYQAGKQQWPEHAELRGKKFDKGVRVEQRPAQSGIVSRVEVADKAVAPIPPEIR